MPDIMLHRPPIPCSRGRVRHPRRGSAPDGAAGDLGPVSGSVPLGIVATCSFGAHPAGRNPVATYVGGILVPAVMLAVSGLGLFGVYALVVLIATLVDVVRERVVAARR